jgi:hypothetical protein
MVKQAWKPTYERMYPRRCFRRSPRLSCLAQGMRRFLEGDFKPAYPDGQLVEDHGQSNAPTRPRVITTTWISSHGGSLWTSLY